MRLTVCQTEGSIVLRFQPVASELGKQGPVTQGAGFSLKPEEEHLRAQAG